MATTLKLKNNVSKGILTVYTKDGGWLDFDLSKNLGQEQLKLLKKHKPELVETVTPKQ